MQPPGIQQLRWVLAVGLAVALARPASATQQRSGQNVTLPPTQSVPDNLAVAGNTVLIEGSVEDDVLAAGN